MQLSKVCSGSQHTSIDSFTADEDEFQLRKLDKRLHIRRRKPPDEPKTMGDIVDWQRLRNWIKECTAHHIHDDPIHPPGGDILGSLLFIDVEKGCIVSASSLCKYIALSYVWGDHTAETIQTTKQSIDSLRQVGSLLGQVIPATIRDAMATCHLLGVPYLWVDRFCIVQDDELKKHEQIRSMGSIYSCALLTICAAAGENANYGLPGVQSRPRAQVRPRTFAFGVEVVPARGNHQSTWDLRGWTYQEMVLSRRRLVFTDEEVFFECNQGSSAEVSTPMEPPSPYVSLDGFDTKLESYMNHIRKYTRRNLSYKTDVYNAFAGVSGSIYPSKGLIHGVPTSAFDEAILWETLSGHNNDRWSRQNFGKDLYVPSWSWASQFGHAVSHSMHFPVLGSFAKWSFVEQQDQVQVIESADTPMGWTSFLNRSCYDPRLYLALAWREHVIESSPSFTICWDRSFGEIESHVINEWPSYRDYWEEAHGRTRIERNVQRQSVGRLLVRTSVAIFRLGAPKKHFRVSGQLMFVVYSDNNFPCGWVGLPPTVFEKEMPEIVESVPTFGKRNVQLIALSCTHLAGTHLEIILRGHYSLSKGGRLKSSPNHESRFDSMDSKMGDPSSYYAEFITPETTYYDSANSPLYPLPAIKVMMISWQGDVAYRVGLGMVLLRQWNKANPTFRTIILG